MRRILGVLFVKMGDQLVQHAAESLARVEPGDQARIGVETEFQPALQVDGGGEAAQAWQACPEPSPGASLGEGKGLRACRSG